MGRAEGSLAFLHGHSSHGSVQGPAASGALQLPVLRGGSTVLSGGMSRAREGYWPGGCWENWEGCPGGTRGLGIGPVPASVTTAY